ncbi:MAG: manganese efflux pump [Clostridiales bacterium]|nr:manganese efflux pump [Clostridiales bacterium]
MENWLLVTVLSFDTLFACMTYGMKRIKIPFFSAAAIAVVGAGCLMISILTRSFTDYLLTDSTAENLIKYIGFAVLIIMGTVNLFQSLLKRLVHQEKTIRFNVSELNFVLKICMDETKADVDCSKRLSVWEACLLAATLSVDSLLSGFSIQGNMADCVGLGIYSLVMGFLAVYSGIFLGKRISRCGYHLSWLSGIILILIAFFKMI